MPNYISNTLTVTGPNPAAVIAATTRKFTDSPFKFEETGSDTSYYSDYAVAQLDPTFDPTLQVWVAPDEQRLDIFEDMVAVAFDSNWVGPWVGVAALSRMFPENTLRVKSYGEMLGFPCIVLVSYKAGVETCHDPREFWSPDQMALAAKYNAIVTSDMHRGGDKTAGTIVIDGVKHEWTFIAAYCGAEADGVTPGVGIPNVILTEEQQHEIYDAVVDVLQAWPLDDEATVQDPLNEVVTA